MKATVVDNVQRHRYEVVHDGTRAGFADYRLEDGVIAFTHTEIDEQYTGLGLASTLIRHALEDSRSKSLTVLPYCPFVRGYIGKHPEYQDLVPDGWTP